MSLFITSTSTLPVKANDSDSSEQVSQLLYGETFICLSKTQKWMKIKVSLDGYEGWIALEYEPKIANAQRTSVLLITAARLPLDSGGSLWLSPGSHLSPIEFAEILQDEQKPLDSSLIDTATLFLHTPYLWGGRSIWGIDCSGLTQVVLSIHGIQIPRDASQQAQASVKVSYDERRAGDLVFFVNPKKGNINHVGILMDNDKIIHASGKVRVDSIDAKGIIRQSDGKRTHTLHSIGRFSTSAP